MYSQLAKDYNVEIFLNEDFPKGETDFRTTVAKIANDKVDAVITSLLPPSLSSFSKQLRQALPNVKILGFAQAQNGDEVKAAQGGMDNLVFSAVSIDSTFADEYSKAYGEDVQTYAAYSHDLVLMLGSILTNDNHSTESVSTAVRSVKNFSGACGTYNANSSNAFDLKPVILTVRNAKFEPFKD